METLTCFDCGGLDEKLNICKRCGKFKGDNDPICYEFSDAISGINHYNSELGYRSRNRGQKSILGGASMKMAFFVIFIVMMVSACSSRETRINFHDAQFSAENPAHVEKSMLTAMKLLNEHGHAVTYSETNIYTYHDPYYMQIELNLSEQHEGYYSPSFMDIHLLNTCSFKCAVHEWMHFFLHKSGVPLDEHHSITGRVLWKSM